MSATSSAESGVAVGASPSPVFSIKHMESNLATRLNRVANKQTVILTHYGRKSGKPHNVKIWFVVECGKVYIGTANMNHQWTRNVQKTARVRLATGGDISKVRPGSSPTVRSMSMRWPLSGESTGPFCRLLLWAEPLPPLALCGIGQARSR